MNDDYEQEPLTLISALESMNAENLRRLATLTGAKPPGRKAEMAKLVAAHLAGERLLTVWEGLDELQQAAVSEAVHSSFSRFDRGFFRAKYGRHPNWGSGDSRYGRKPSALCFFFYGSDFMPADLKARLMKFVPEPRRAAIATLDSLPSVYGLECEEWNEKTRTRQKVIEEIPLAVHETERAAQRDLVSVLRLVDAGKVAVSDKTRRASASTIEAIKNILDGGDYYPHVEPASEWDDENAGPIRAFAWPMLIQAGKLAQLAGPRLQLTAAGRKALSEPAAGTIRNLWLKWRDTTILDELSRIDCVKGQSGKGKRGLTAVSGRRQAIAATLALCPPGGWIETADFVRYMRATENDLDVTRDAWNLYISDQHYGSLGYDGSTRILNERYVLGVLLEYAATLGMIDVALIPPAGARDDYGELWGTDELPFFSRYDGLMYFRLTPLGAYCLDVESEYRPAPVEESPVLWILPNLEITAAGPDIEQSDRLALNVYATPVSEFVWRLETGKLLTAIESGRPVEEIRDFLTARSNAALPATVERLLDDAAERATLVRDRGLARVIECADPALTELIANDPRTRKHCIRSGERQLVVLVHSEKAFRRGLLEAGYLLSPGDKRMAKAAGAKAAG